MSAIVSPEATTVLTLADVVRRLGAIPLDRILMRPYPGSATEEDVIECEARTGRLCELVDGILVEKAVGYYEDRLGVVLVFFLEQFVGENGSGIVLGPAGMIRTEDVQVRMPRLTYFSWAPLPHHGLPPGDFLCPRPELVVENLSPE